MEILVRARFPMTTYCSWEFAVPAIKRTFSLSSPSDEALRRIIKAYVRYKDVDLSVLAKRQARPAGYLEEHMYGFTRAIDIDFTS